MENATVVELVGALAKESRFRSRGQRFTKALFWNWFWFEGILSGHAAAMLAGRQLPVGRLFDRSRTLAQLKLVRSC